ncbi:hypothetical protein [Aureimonas sp. AU40]|uniref:hypothetical protein n=1 Tax=Aureimonas sp. AU40 TaxID=1637747 RepID=UPI0012E35246|nr:hypothetical protein [Aureimonas sp. AU40]
MADLADAADDFADPTLRAARPEPPESVAGFAGSTATGFTRLLPGGSGRAAQDVPMLITASRASAMNSNPPQRLMASDLAALSDGKAYPLCLEML